jgi:hypothetical protein
MPACCDSETRIIQIADQTRGKMHIVYERSGGFTGMTSSYSFNLEDLPEEEANKLRMLIEEVDFPALPDKLEEAGNSPDQFTYSITIESQEWSHTVVTGDSSAPLEIKPLLESLNTVSRSHRKIDS